MKKYVVFVFAILILYFGVALCYKADIGVGPNDAMFLTVSKLLNMKVGTISIIGCFIYLILQIIILRKDFKYKEFIQIFLILFSGFLLNIFLYNLLDKFNPSNYIFRVFLYTISVFIKTIGVLLILSSGVCKTCAEGLADAIASKVKLKMGIVRQLMDVVFIIIVLLLALIFKSKITIGLGTIIDMVLFGPLLELMKRPFRNRKLEVILNERNDVQ